MYLGVFQAVTAMILTSSVPLVVKLIDADPIVIGVVRLVVGYLFTLLITVVWLRQRPVLIFSAPLRKPLFLIGTLFGLHWLTFFISIKLSTPATAAIGVASYGIFLLIYGKLFLGENISAVGAVSILMAIVGNYLVAPSFSVQDEVTLGLLMGILSGLFYALVPIVFKKFPHLTAAEKTQGQFAFALPMFLLLLPWSSWQLTTNDWWGLLFMGVFCTGVGHALWIRSSSTLPTALTSTLFYTSVPSTLLMSVLLDQEVLSAAMLTGAVMIVSANWLTVYWQVRLKSRY